MLMTQLLQTELLVMVLFMSGCFVLALAVKRNDIADIIWGLAFIVAVVTALFTSDEVTRRSFLASTLVFIWGGRLSIRILLRNLKKSEDFRYKEWREQWGDKFLIRTFLQVFMLQGVLALVVVSPVLMIIAAPATRLAPLDYIGVAVWVIGFFFETVGDYQLDVFKRRPSAKGKIMKTGLWRYSRHPNYFGEVTMWWGLYLIALSVPYGFLSFIGPLTITTLILKVSGIPMLEKKYKENAAFQEYAKKTNAFFPWPPKS